jgi:hypothetical protein
MIMKLHDEEPPTIEDDDDDDDYANLLDHACVLHAAGELLKLKVGLRHGSRRPGLTRRAGPPLASTAAPRVNDNNIHNHNDNRRCHSR